MTPIEIRSGGEVVHTYRSVFTWWNSMKRASYKVKLDNMLWFAKQTTITKEEYDFAIKQIEDIKQNHESALHPAQNVVCKYEWDR